MLLAALRHLLVTDIGESEPVPTSGPLRLSLRRGPWAALRWNTGAMRSGAGRPMHVEQWGPTHDPTALRALLVHGITSSAGTMFEIGEGLAAEGWAVTAVDLPGHGCSDATGSCLFADVADALALQLGAGFDLYVGHSLGGAIGTVLMARHLLSAHRAVLIDPALRVTAEQVAGIPTELVADKALSADDVVAKNPRWHPRTVRARMRATEAADVDSTHSLHRDHRRLCCNAAWPVSHPARAWLSRGTKGRCVDYQRTMRSAWSVHVRRRCGCVVGVERSARGGGQQPGCEQPDGGGERVLDADVVGQQTTQCGAHPRCRHDPVAVPARVRARSCQGLTDHGTPFRQYAAEFSVRTGRRGHGRSQRPAERGSVRERTPS
jgi:pimeloyl-ACP methyl ester carboxylesterase